MLSVCPSQSWALHANQVKLDIIPPPHTHTHCYYSLPQRGRVAAGEWSYPPFLGTKDGGGGDRFSWADSLTVPVELAKAFLACPLLSSGLLVNALRLVLF